MVEEYLQSQVLRNLRDTEKRVRKNDEELAFIQMEKNLRSITRMIMNESETTSSQLGRKSTESGNIWVRHHENVLRKSLIVKNL